MIRREEEENQRAVRRAMPLFDIFSSEIKVLFAIFSLLISILLIGLVAIHHILKRRFDEQLDYLKESFQQELVEQNELLLLATEVTQAGIWDYRPMVKMSYLSQYWYSMLGYNQQDKALSLSELKDYIHPDDMPYINQIFREYIFSGGKGHVQTEFRLLKADGTWCWVLSKGKAVEWNKDGIPSRIIGLDVSIQPLIEAHEKVIRSEALFRSIFENAPYPIVLNNFDDGKYIEANRAFLKSRDISKEELFNLKVEDFIIISAEEKKNMLKTLLETGFVEEREATFIKNDGTRGYASYSSVLLDILGQKQVLSITVDMTEKKHAEQEREKLQRQLLQSQKMEAIGILAGGVAHDFNNMLGAIMGYAELTVSKIESSDPLSRNLNRILDATKRSANLTRQLLAFARKQTIAPVVFNLNESIEALLKMVRRLIGENIELIWLPSTTPCVVMMDTSQLDQIMVNLCVNSKDAIGNSVGRITIETKSVFFDESYCTSHVDAKPGQYVLLAVSDNGCGIDKESLEHIFEPFFTTKGLGKGTGMGLATVYGIVKQNSGIIHVYSEPNQGTTIKIYIPYHNVEQIDAITEIFDDIPQGRGETILIVEDDPTLLEMSILMLEQLGYSVIPADTPNRAISIVQEESSKIDLFITDVIMPEMNGRELANILSGICPSIKQLFMSGYTANVIAHQGVLEKGVNFLHKPFTLKELATKIREVLC